MRTSIYIVKILFTTTNYNFFAKRLCISRFIISTVIRICYIYHDK